MVYTTVEGAFVIDDGHRRKEQPKDKKEERKGKLTGAVAGASISVRLIRRDKGSLGL